MCSCEHAVRSTLIKMINRNCRVDTPKRPFASHGGLFHERMDSSFCRPSVRPLVLRSIVRHLRAIGTAATHIKTAKYHSFGDIFLKVFLVDFSHFSTMKQINFLSKRRRKCREVAGTGPSLCACVRKVSQWHGPNTNMTTRWERAHFNELPIVYCRSTFFKSGTSAFASP